MAQPTPRRRIISQGQEFEGKSFDNYKYSPNFILLKEGSYVVVDEKVELPLRYSLLQWVRHPLNKYHRWFRVKIVSTMIEGQNIMVGINKMYEAPPLSWDLQKSLRYSSLEGGVYSAGEGLHSDSPYGTGDSVICYLEKVFPERTLFNFFKNGKLVYRQWLKVTPEDLYPAIGVNHGPLELEVTWPGADISDAKIPIDVKHLSSWIGYQLISKDDKANVVEVVGHDEIKRPGYQLQGPRALDVDHSYFEVKLLTRNDPEMGCAIGLTPGWSSKFQYPGWKENTIAYHSDDGGIYHEQGEGSVYKEDSMMCIEGDRMGCGVIFNKKITGNDVNGHPPVTVYFTKNGNLVYSKFVLPSQEGFYPSIGMYPLGDRLEIIYPCKPPKVTKDIDAKLPRMGKIFNDFRFCQAITFENSQRNRLELLTTSPSPVLVQYVKDTSAEPYFELEVKYIDEKTTIQMGAAPTTMPLQGEALQTETRNALIIRRSEIQLGEFGRLKNVSLGDRLGCFIRRSSSTEVMLCYTINEKVFGRVTALHNTGETMRPTLAIITGPVHLKVLWPDDTASIQPHRNPKDAGHWLAPDTITVVDQTFCRPKVVNTSDVMIALAPVPLPEQVPCYIQFTVTMIGVALPGLGLTSGVLDPVVKRGQVINNTIVFLPSSKKLLTPTSLSEDGVKQNFLKRQELIEDRVGVLVWPLGQMAYSLQFGYNGRIAATFATVMPPGGFFPLLYFDNLSTGTTVEILVVDDPDIASQQLSAESLLQLQSEPTILNYDGDDMGFVGKTNGREKLSTVQHLYISHSPTDLPAVQQLIDGFQEKGYGLQTTTGNVSSLERFVNLDMSDVVLFCLSPLACNNQDQIDELQRIKEQSIPVMPVMVGPCPWPPGGLYTRFQTFLQGFTKVKIDLVGQTIGEMEVGWIELHVPKCIELTDSLERSSDVDSEELYSAGKNYTEDQDEPYINDSKFNGREQKSSRGKYRAQIISNNLYTNTGPSSTDSTVRQSVVRQASRVQYTYVDTQDMPPSHHLSTENSAAYCSLLESLDEDGNKFLSKDELKTFMFITKKNVTDEEMNTVYRGLHTYDSADNKVEFDDFFCHAEGEITKGSKAELQEAFKSFDKNGNGKIEMNELQDILEAFEGSESEEDIQAFLEEVDKSNDGAISFEMLADFIMQD